MGVEANSKPAIPDKISDNPAWEKCRPPFWPRRTIDGGWTSIPSGQAWRRKFNGKWQYKRELKDLRANETRQRALSTQPIVSLQYLRAVAAVAVVVHHFSEAFYYKTHVGAAGVDVFFVISGFVMALVTARSVSPVKFLTDRLIRIVPMYWLCTLFLFACVRAKPNLFPLDSSDTSHLLKSLFFIPHISPLGTMYPLVSQVWTLVYEMFFYAIFACALWVSQAHKIAIVSITIFAVVGLGALLQSHNIAVSTFTSPLMIEFVAGLWLFSSYRRGAMPGAVISTVLVLISLTWFAVVEFVQPPYRAVEFEFIQPPFRLVELGVPAFFLVTGFLGLEKYIKAKASLLVIGNASYSIYLTHWFSLLFVRLTALKLGVSGWPVIAASFPAAVVLGIAAYKFIEVPIIRTLKAASRREGAVA